MSREKTLFLANNGDDTGGAADMVERRPDRFNSRAL
jgi:hypothetical protein